MPKLYPGYRDEIRKKIIAEAFAVFLEKGFEKTTMDEVASRLGVTKPAIYRYFKNKEELFFASVVESVMGEYTEIFSHSFATDDLLAGAGLFFDELVRFDQKYTAIALDITPVILRNENLRKGLTPYQEKGIRVLQEFFDEQKKVGKIRTSIDGRDLAILVSILSHGLTESIQGGLDPAEAKRVWLTGFVTITGIRAGRKK
jgi:AcrR family transcriptional regulator